MPGEPLRRSSRIEHHKRQAEAENNKIGHWEATGSSWITKSRRKQLQSVRPVAGRSQRGRTAVDQPAEVRKVESSRPLQRPPANTDTVKQAKNRKGKQSKQAREVPESSQVE